MKRRPHPTLELMMRRRTCMFKFKDSNLC
jgi:hypothetical protein